MADNNGRINARSPFYEAEWLTFSDETEAVIAEKSFEKAQNRATPVPESEAILSKQDCPEDKIIRTLHPKEIFRKGDYAIYDIGENV